MYLKKHKLKLRTLVALLLLITFVPIVIFILFKPQSSQAVWYDDTYAFRQKISFTHNAALTNRRVSITIDTAALTTDKMQADCDDTRFTDINGLVLRFQEVSGCDTSTTVYDVIFPTIINGTNVAYVYYGNSNVTNASEDMSAFTSLSPSGGAPSLSSEEKGTGPITYWKFDEGVDNTCIGGTNDLCNSMGLTDFDGTYTSGISRKNEEECINGKCLYFDGTNEYVSIPDSATLDRINGAYSVSLWFYAQTNGFDTYYRRLINRGNNPSQQWYIEVNLSTPDTFLYFCGGSGSQNSTTNTFQENRWYHIEMVNNGSNCIFYIDGQQDSSVAFSGSVGTTGDIGIGGETDNDSGAWYGKVDEVKIYNYARTAAQIKTDYLKQAGSEGSVTTFGSSSQSYLSDGLVGYWKMNESSWTQDCSTTSVSDSSGNGLNGTSCPTTTGPAGGATGKYGLTGDFDGSDDYVTVASPGLPTADFTYAAWVYLDANSDETIFMSGESSGGTDEFRLMFSTGTCGGAGLLCVILNGSGSSINGATTVSTSTWTHVAITRSASAVTLFVNGKIDGSGTDSSTLSFGTCNLIIGMDADGTSSGCTSSAGNWFDGKIDDARVYNRALSNQEIRSLSNWAPGPVLQWKLDEGTGSTAYDISVNGNNGTLTNTPTWTTGRYGNGVAFAGSNQHIIRADDSDLDFIAADNFTISTWFRHTTASAQEAILAKHNATAGGYKILMEADGDITCAIDDDSTWTPDDSATSTAATYDNNAWHHIACVKNANSSLTLYIDGLQIIRDTSITATGSLANADSFYYGIDGDGTSNDFVGNLDDLRVYNYVRSAGQIMEDMNGGHPMGGSPIGTQVGYWKFDEQTGQSANNNVSSNATGTLGANSSVASDDPTWKTQTNCKINGCLSFDGTNDVVTGSDSSFPSGSNARTFTFWMNPSSLPTTDTSAVVFRYGTATTNQVSIIGLTNSGGTHAIRFAGWGNDFDTTYTAQVGTWIHIAASHDGTTTKIYINGQLRNSSTSFSAWNTTLSGTYYIGSNNGGDFFNGNIDEVKLYNAALTQDQVLIDMNANSAINFSVGTNEASSLTDGAGNPPIGYWNLDENTGTSAKDISGTGNNGTVTGGSTIKYTSGVYGNGIEQAGSSERVDITPSGDSLDPSDQMTIEAWVWLDVENKDQKIVLKKHSVSPFVSYELFYQTSTDEFRFQWVNTSGTFYTARYTGGVSTGRWYHLVGVKDSTAVRIYINGAATNTITASPTGTLYNSDGDVHIGADDGSTDVLDGKYDEVKIYNYARTKAQVTYDYNRGKPISWWRFDECTGNTTYDSTGYINGSNGEFIGTITIGGTGTYTSAGACGSGTSTHAWNAGTTGKYNSSIAFDGTNDYIALNAKLFETVCHSTACTLTFWIYGAAYSDAHVIYEKASGRNNFAAKWPSSSSDTFTFHIGDNTDRNSTKANFSLNTWYHIGLSWDGTTIKIYIDGKLDRSISAIDLTTTGNSNTQFGREDSGPGNYFNGLLDDIRLYNYVLSAGQILQVYNEHPVRFGPTTGQP